MPRVRVLQTVQTMQTRRMRRAEARAAERHLLELPADILGLVLFHLPLAHDIAATALTCHAFHDAAKIVQKLRPFTGKIRTLVTPKGNVGHKAELNCVAAAPGNRIITGADKGIVHVWRDNKCVTTHEAHDAHVIAVAVLPGGERLVSVSTDCTVKMWDLTKRGVPLVGTCNMGSVVLSVAAVGTDRFVVGGWQEASLFNVDGTHLHTFEGHTSSVNALAATPDGKYVASGGYDTIVNVWDVEGGSLVSKCEGPAGLVRAVAFMADSKRVLSGSDGGAVRVWLLDGTHQNTFEGLHAQTVLALVALPDNVHALSGGNDIKLFNVNDGGVLRAFKHHTHTVSGLTLLPDGLRFASVSYDRTVRIVEHGLAPTTLAKAK